MFSVWMNLLWFILASTRWRMKCKRDVIFACLFGSKGSSHTIFRFGFEHKQRLQCKTKMIRMELIISWALSKDRKTKMSRNELIISWAQSKDEQKWIDHKLSTKQGLYNKEDQIGIIYKLSAKQRIKNKDEQNGIDNNPIISHSLSE